MTEGTDEGETGEAGGGQLARGRSPSLRGCWEQRGREPHQAMHPHPRQGPPLPSGRTWGWTTEGWDLSPGAEEPPNTHVLENSWSVSLNHLK